MIEPIKKAQGVPRATAICDDCGKRETFACGYGKDGQPNEGQVISKANKQGWSYVKGALRCATCEARRKVVPMKKPEPKPEPLRQPTKKQRIEIFKMLSEVYDLDAERYHDGETDDTVADVLGVMPGWVTEIRETNFGPDGGNENIEELEAKIAQFEPDVRAMLQAAQQVTTNAERKLAEVSAMKADLERIKKAVGPRKLQQAGVK